MKISRDTNGNKVLKIEKCDLKTNVRGFSIQTLGNLPFTHNHGICLKTKGELLKFISEHGTERQKAVISKLLITRDDYMNYNGKMIHHAFYSQFVLDATIGFVLNEVGKDKLMQSKDFHLNDIDIKHSNGGTGSWLWDFSPANLNLARELGAVGKNSIGSPSFYTCVGKAAARMIINDQV